MSPQYTCDLFLSLKHGFKYTAIATMLQLKLDEELLHVMELCFVYSEDSERSAADRMDALFGSSVSDRPEAVASTAFIQI